MFYLFTSLTLLSYYLSYLLPLLPYCHSYLFTFLTLLPFYTMQCRLFCRPDNCDWAVR